MPKSPEFPTLQFVSPRSFTRGRKPGQPRVFLMHTTEGSEGRQSAEDGAAYDARRTDGTSTHFFVDQDTIVQCVLTTDEAHAARSHGNDIGIQIEVCGRAGQSSAQWNDEASAGTIENVARLCVMLRKKYPFPLVNLSPSELAAGKKGFAEHYDATQAFPSDGGTHTDPGKNFPWSKLFARIRELEGTDDMTPDQLLDFDSVPNVYPSGAGGETITVRSALKAGVSADVKLSEVLNELNDVKATLAAILSALKLPPSGTVTKP